MATITLKSQLMEVLQIIYKEIGIDDINISRYVSLTSKAKPMPVPGQPEPLDFVNLATPNNPETIAFWLSYKYPAGYNCEDILEIMISTLRSFYNEQVDEYRRFDLNKPFSVKVNHEKTEDPKLIAAKILEGGYNNITNTVQDWLRVNLDDVNYLSLLPYETKGPYGDIVFVDSNLITNNALQNISFNWQFFSVQDEVDFCKMSMRQIRKLFSGVGDGALLIEVKNDQTSLPRCKGVINKKDKYQFMFRIHIESAYNWSLFRNEKCIFRTTYTSYLVGNPAIKKRASKRIKKEFSKQPSKALIKLIEMFCSLKQGASLMVIDPQGLNHEIIENRLQQLCKHYKSIKTNHSPIKAIEAFSVTAIDGSLVVDTEGNLLYIATLVDGLTCKRGDLSRGSRYNNIQNFVKDLSTYHVPIFAIVRSADGMVDMFSGFEMKDKH